jgi:hypothetical protein
MHMRSYVAAVSIGALAVAVSVASCKCNKEEEVPPMPSATAAPTPSAPLELAADLDAGSDADAADGDAADVRRVGTGQPNDKLLACCRNIAQNAKSAPPPQNAFMMQAAAQCEASVRSGNGNGAVAIARANGVNCSQ